MLYTIHDCSISFGADTILSHINFEIRDGEKIALVGRNGAGKTTLLKIMMGRLEPDRDDKRCGPAISLNKTGMTSPLIIDMLSQTSFADKSHSVEEEMLASCPTKEQWDQLRYEYEVEFDRLLTGFGLSKEDKKKKISEFSGGEQTKLGLIRLLLKKPDILLLDEPTNHLDEETIEWLEEYLKSYRGAVVMVSHDRYFLDRCADIIYELSDKKLYRYVGNYSQYREVKAKHYALDLERYNRQQAEINRLTGVIERFKHKPTKASMARSKGKYLERMERVDRPVQDDARIYPGQIVPEIYGPKCVWDCEHLKVGYDKELFELTFRIRRGQKLAVLGPNGSGKSTLLKTIAGLIEPLKGESRLGERVTIGYFDQHSAEITSEKSVIEYYHDLYPSLTDKEIRSELGRFLFEGKMVSKRVDSLSGGEKARLVLALLLKAAPNFLILDEPTNHMDIPTKETIESALCAYEGTLLLVSHDRYMVRKVAKAILTIEEAKVMYYPFGYEHFMERKRKDRNQGSLPAQVTAEDEALVAGLRAVPKAERHRLREIPTQEAYQDWLHRLSGEEMNRNYERLMEAVELLFLSNGEAQTIEACRRVREAEESYIESCIVHDLERPAVIHRQEEPGSNG